MSINSSFQKQARETVSSRGVSQEIIDFKGANTKL
jgi:hypothetical protein